MKFVTASRITLLILLLVSSITGNAQTVLDGVYSSSQAQRGARTYQRICADCHEGGEPDAEPLFGHAFIERWREAPLSYLHGFFSSNMPADEPGSLSADVYLDALAYLLSENGYPAGNAALRADMLESTLLTGPDGPQTLPANALVLATGCLNLDGDKAQLLQASGFTRVRTADETTSEQLARSSAAEPGTATYVLGNSERFDTAALTGKKVQAKGVLYLTAPDFTINVLSLEAAGPGCD